MYIYISLWTNYNKEIHLHLSLPCTIYISLWTNYNECTIDIDYEEIKFTFHYELIITVILMLIYTGVRIFTFHYELIITVVDAVSIPVLAIYISLWTNYNNYTKALMNIRSTFTFHYELIITSHMKLISCVKIDLHFTMN